MALFPLYHECSPHGRMAVKDSVTFQAGFVGQLEVVNGERVIGPGYSMPFGILDDDKETSFEAPVIGEDVLVTRLVTATTTLANARIVSDGNYKSYKVWAVDAAGAVSALTETTDYTINVTNGIITIASVASLPAAYVDADGDGSADSIYLRVNYRYAVPGVLGKDTTLASGLATAWFLGGEFRTDMYDTTATYAVNTKLYAGDGSSGKAVLGMLTVAANTDGGAKSIGFVTKPPTAANSYLEFVFRPEQW